MRGGGEEKNGRRRRIDKNIFWRRGRAARKVFKANIGQQTEQNS